jgi:hypothetical protein
VGGFANVWQNLAIFAEHWQNALEARALSRAAEKVLVNGSNDPLPNIAKKA